MVGEWLESVEQTDLTNKLQLKRTEFQKMYEFNGLIIQNYDLESYIGLRFSEGISVK